MQSADHIELAGEQLTLLAEAAIFWPATGTIFISDLHLGKAGSGQTPADSGPPAATSADLARLAVLLDQTQASSLVCLGDWLHARNSRDEATLHAVSEWRTQHPSLEIMLVRGNHERHGGDPPSEWRMRCVNGPYRLGPFALNHEPAAAPQGYVLSGHLHPAVQPAASRERLPAFIFGPRIAMLPAFGSCIRTTLIRPEPGNRVYVIAERQLIGPL